MFFLTTLHLFVIVIVAFMPYFMNLALWYQVVDCGVVRLNRSNNIFESHYHKLVGQMMAVWVAVFGGCVKEIVLFVDVSLIRQPVWSAILTHEWRYY